MSGRGRGRGRGRAAPRAPVSLVGRSRSTPATATAPAGPRPTVHSVADHVTTVGVKRTSFGASGTAVKVYTNHYEVTVPKSIIHHYDGEWHPTFVRETNVLIILFSYDDV